MRRTPRRFVHLLDDLGQSELAGDLAEEFSADPQTLVRVASIFRDVRERAPDLFVPGAGALATAFGAA